MSGHRQDPDFIGPPHVTREELRRRYYDMLERETARDARPAPVKSLEDKGHDATPERMAMAGDQVERFIPSENENWKAIRLLDTHVLEFLQSRSIITGDQYSAGVQFYSDWYMAGLANSGVIDPGRVIVDGGQIDHLSEVRMNALHRWQRAVQALGLIHSQVLTDILLSEEPLVQWGRRRCGQQSTKLAKLAAQTAIKLSLEALDLHYHGHRHTPSRAAHANDYRPTIQPQPDTP